MVGTSCVCVARCCSSKRKNASGSNFSITTTVPPSAMAAIEKRSGAA